MARNYWSFTKGSEFSPISTRLFILLALFLTASSLPTGQSTDGKMFADSGRQMCKSQEGCPDMMYCNSMSGYCQQRAMLEELCDPNMDMCRRGMTCQLNNMMKTSQPSYPIYRCRKDIVSQSELNINSMPGFQSRPNAPLEKHRTPEAFQLSAQGSMRKVPAGHSTMITRPNMAELLLKVSEILYNVKKLREEISRDLSKSIITPRPGMMGKTDDVMADTQGEGDMKNVVENEMGMYRQRGCQRLEEMVGALVSSNNEKFKEHLLYVILACITNGDQTNGNEEKSSPQKVAGEGSREPDDMSMTGNSEEAQGVMAESQFGDDNGEQLSKADGEESQLERQLLQLLRQNRNERGDQD